MHNHLNSVHNIIVVGLMEVWNKLHFFEILLSSM